jgi:hypothetical protein
MAILANLIRTVLKSVLLNKTTRYVLIAALLKFGRYFIRPSSISRIKSLFGGLSRAASGSGKSSLFSSLLRGAAELLLLIFAKRGGFSGRGVLSALAAVLLAMSRERDEGQAKEGRRRKEQIIDLDEYTILDENH